MTKTCCLNCKDRQLGCHAACLRYNEAERMAGRVAFAERVGVDDAFYEYNRKKTTRLIRSTQRRRP